MAFDASGAGGGKFWGLFGLVVLLHFAGGAIIVTFCNTTQWASGGITVLGGSTYTILEFFPGRYTFNVDNGSGTITTFSYNFYRDYWAHQSADILALFIQQVLMNIGGGFALWTGIFYICASRSSKYGSHLFAKASVMSAFSWMIAGGGFFFFIGFNFYNNSVVNFDSSSGNFQTVYGGVQATGGGFFQQIVCSGQQGGSWIKTSTFGANTALSTQKVVECSNVSIKLGYSMVLVAVGLGLLGLGSILALAAHIMTCMADEATEYAGDAKSAATDAVTSIGQSASAAASGGASVSVSVSVEASGAASS